MTTENLDILVRKANDFVMYHRNPTKAEIRFGEGAVHYKSFPFPDVWDAKNNRCKRWLVCPEDGLRYFY